MLEYEWGNPGNIILTGEEPNQELDQTRQSSVIFDLHHYNPQPSFADHNFLTQQPFSNFNNQTQAHSTSNVVHAFYDIPRTYVGGGGGGGVGSTSTYSLPLPHHHHNHHQSLLSPDCSTLHGGGGGYFVVPKSEGISRPVDYTSRIGLNLGGRTYFSSAEDDFVNRLYRWSRPGELGPSNAPRCQAEGCNADLTQSKHYHRRHKVCEFHSKASTVVAAGITQRFCQQCSRFHLLSEFDNGKRSCRKRLADHNRRRRKSQQQTNQQENQKPQQHVNALINSPSVNLTRLSPPDSGPPSSSSVKIAVSPPRISLDYFRPSMPYQAAASSSKTTKSLFFSSG